MGLIKAALGSLNQVVGDQFKEFITCPPVANDVIIQRGTVQHGDANKTFTEGVISNGSGIAVPDGMAMMIVDNGKIVEFTAEAGTFTYDSSSEPSIFYGGLGHGLLESIKTIGSRITYGGQPAKDQRVYYVNIKKIPGLTYGSQQPLLIIDKIYRSINITYNGQYEIRVADPAILIANVVGSNPKDTLKLNDIFTSEGNTSMLKQQFAQNIGQAIAQTLKEQNISFIEIAGYYSNITAKMNELLGTTWGANYGIVVENVVVNTAPTEESRKIITDMDAKIAEKQLMSGVYSDNMQGAMAEDFGRAMNTAAGNEAGAMMGFMGMNMASMAGGNVMGNILGQAQQVTPQQPVQQAAPVQPVAPAAPAAPVTPVEPVAPVASEAPAAPVEPAAPVAPEAPAEPETPAE